MDKPETFAIESDGFSVIKPPDWRNREYLSFLSDDGVIGTLKTVDGTMVFEGDADETARRLFDFMISSGYMPLKAHIEALESRLAEQQWVPVSERLPENHERVLGCHKEGIEIVMYDEKDERFYDDTYAWTLINFWRPLPSPPEDTP